MTKDEIIAGLESLINDAESHMMPDEPEDSIFRDDVRVLEAAIKIIRREDESC